MKRRICAVLLSAVVMLQCAGAAPVLAGADTARTAGTADSGNPGVEQPGETENPEETEQPGETEKPGGTERPEETENPEETEQPGETEKPGGTEQPEETENPEETEKPGPFGPQTHVHVWDQEEVGREPTCTEDGIRLIICSVCGATKKEPLRAAHTPGSWKTEREPTCEQRGKRVQSCRICGEIVRKEAIPQKEHIWGEWQRLCDATLYNPGQEWCRCAACGQTRTRSVRERLAAGLILTPMEITMKVGESGRLIKASGIAPGDAVVSWKSGNSKIASVTPHGCITAKREGQTTITVTLASDMTVRARVIVKGFVRTRKITGVPAKLTLKKGKKRTLHPKLKPSNSVERITYRSSNKKVARVNKKGRITAGKKGTAVITVRSGSKAARCLIRVK